MPQVVELPCDESVIVTEPAAGAPESPFTAPRNPGLWVLVATILGSSMAFIDGTVVNVALPVLQTDLHATATEVQWVVEAYAPVSGRANSCRRFFG